METVKDLNAKEGMRVKVISMIDDPNPIPANEEGTIVLIDDMGTLHVKWDDGRRLGLIPGIDRYVLEPEEFSNLMDDAFSTIDEASGRGILHEEMPQRGPSGVIYGFQLWVNLPAAEKMSPPRYRGLTAEMLPVVAINGVKTRLVAGTYGGAVGPVTELTARPLYMDVTLDPQARFDLDVPRGHTAVAYLFEGQALFGLDQACQGEPVNAVSMVVFEDGDCLSVQASTDASRPLYADSRGTLPRTDLSLRPVCHEHHGRNPTGHARPA